MASIYAASPKQTTSSADPPSTPPSTDTVETPHFTTRGSTSEDDLSSAITEADLEEAQPSKISIHEFIGVDNAQMEAISRGLLDDPKTRFVCKPGDRELLYDRLTGEYRRIYRLNGSMVDEESGEFLYRTTFLKAGYASNGEPRWERRNDEEYMWLAKGSLRTERLEKEVEECSKEYARRARNEGWKQQWMEEQKREEREKERQERQEDLAFFIDTWRRDVITAAAEADAADLD